MGHSIQTTGNFTLTLNHPLIAGGTTITIQGAKLDQQFIDTAQMMDNTKRVALVGGGTAALTNAVKSGDLTVNCVRISDNMLEGDLPLIASTLQGLGDSQGGVIRATYGFNGGTEGITFLFCTVKSCPPLKLAGNDLPDYPIVFSYADFTRDNL